MRPKKNIIEKLIEETVLGSCWFASYFSLDSI